MASPTVPIECGICLGDYNNSTQRPRVLPCSHNFCGKCLQKSISRDGIMCSICRKKHSVETVDDIPINTDLEKFIQMWSLMSISKTKQNSTSEEEEDFSHGNCSKHSKSLLYFKCKTHDIYICRECTVIQHTPSKCDIVEIKEEAMKTKEATLKEAWMVIDFLASETTTLETILKDTNEGIISTKSKIESLLKEVDEESIVCDQTQKYIDENKSVIRQLQGSIERLNQSNTNKNINNDCKEIQVRIVTLGKHSQKMENYFSKLLSMDPKRAMEIMQERKMEVYAVDGNSGDRSTKIESRNGRLHFSSLKRIARPTTNTTTIPISTLLSALGVEPILYLKLSGGKDPFGTIRNLGIVKIRLTCGSKRREEMLRLFTATEGQHYKGSWFDVAWNVGRAGEGLGCYGYKTCDGNRSDTSIVQGLEDQECERYVEGAVTGYMDNANFMICTKTQPPYTNTTIWQKLGPLIQITVPAVSWTGPEIGHVVSGLGILKAALRQYATHDIGPFYDASEIQIQETGVEISTHPQNKCGINTEGVLTGNSRKRNSAKIHQYIEEPFSQSFIHEED